MYSPDISQTITHTVHQSDQYTHCTSVTPVHTLYISQTSTHTVHQSHQYTHCTPVTPVHTLYISYFMEHNGEDKPRDGGVQVQVIRKFDLIAFSFKTLKN